MLSTALLESDELGFFFSPTNILELVQCFSAVHSLKISDIITKIMQNKP